MAAAAVVELPAPPPPRPELRLVSAPSRPVINPWIVALTVTIATFMELLDTSIANVSLPYIAGGLGRSYDEVTWILTTPSALDIHHVRNPGLPGGWPDHDHPHQGVPFMTALSS